MRNTLLSSLFCRNTCRWLMLRVMHPHSGVAAVVVYAYCSYFLMCIHSFCSNRNYHSPSLSWSKLLPVAALMESFTWVRLFLKQELYYAFWSDILPCSSLIHKHEQPMSQCVPSPKRAGVIWVSPAPFSSTQPAAVACALLNLQQLTEER